MKGGDGMKGVGGEVVEWMGKRCDLFGGHEVG